MRIRATVLESVPCKIGIVDCQNTVERRCSRRRCLEKRLSGTLHLGEICIEPRDRLFVSLGVIWHKQNFFTMAAVVHTAQEMDELGTVAAHKLYQRLDRIHARVRRNLAAPLSIEHALEQRIVCALSFGAQTRPVKHALGSHVSLRIDHTSPQSGLFSQIVDSQGRSKIPDVQLKPPQRGQAPLWWFKGGIIVG